MKRALYAIEVRSTASGDAIPCYCLSLYYSLTKEICPTTPSKSAPIESATKMLRKGLVECFLQVFLALARMLCRATVPSSNGTRFKSSKHVIHVATLLYRSLDTTQAVYSFLPPTNDDDVTGRNAYPGSVRSNVSKRFSLSRPRWFLHDKRRERSNAKVAPGRRRRDSWLIRWSQLSLLTLRTDDRTFRVSAWLFRPLIASVSLSCFRFLSWVL